MKIIDFERKGNVVRFYLGKDSSTEYYGEGWHKTPYALNAAKVDDKYIVGHKDLKFDFEDIVAEPCHSFNDQWSKNDMKDQKIPCIVVLPKRHVKEDYGECCFDKIIGKRESIKYYFGDILGNDIVD